MGSITMSAPVKEAPTQSIAEKTVAAKDHWLVALPVFIAPALK